MHAINRENFGYSDAHMVPRQMATATPGPADWREALDIVALGLPEQSVEGMKVICHELTQAVDPESSVLDDLIKEADRLVSCLAVMVPKTFNFSLSGASSRSCKYVLNTLMQVCLCTLFSFCSLFGSMLFMYRLYFRLSRSNVLLML
jgi:cytoskeleton-associated protein 5